MGLALVKKEPLAARLRGDVRDLRRLDVRQWAPKRDPLRFLASLSGLI